MKTTWNWELSAWNYTAIFAARLPRVDAAHPPPHLGGRCSLCIRCAMQRAPSIRSRANLHAAALPGLPAAQLGSAFIFLIKARHILLGGNMLPYIAAITPLGKSGK